MSTIPRAGRGWFKSSFSDSSAQCVEINLDGPEVLIRDSKFPGNPAAQPVIRLPRGQWAAFLTAIAQGHNTCPLEQITADGGAVLAHNGIRLGFTPGEWSAFTAGVHQGEFSQRLTAA